MATITWISTAGGDWSDGGNWQGGTVPGATDDAVMSLSMTMTITISTTQHTHSIAFNGADTHYVVTSTGRLETATDMTLTGATLRIGGTLIAGGDVSVTMSGAITIDGSAHVEAGESVAFLGSTGSGGDPTVAPVGAVITAGSIAGIVLTVSCFTPGTRIATATGDRPVETLRIGDTVLLAEGGSAPIIWIGERDADCRDHADLCPVRIHRDAFGPGLPVRDLVLSPDHAIHWAGVLIPIRHLVNGRNIVRDARDRVRYYHLELPHHALLLAEDLPVESYLDTGDRARFDRSRGVVGSPAQIREGLACLPVHVTGPVVDDARLALFKESERCVETVAG